MLSAAGIIGGAAIIGFAIGWVLAWLTEGEVVHWTD